MTYKITESFALTGEVIERDATPEETEIFDLKKIEAEAKVQAEVELKAKRQALLEKLGITEEEAKLLIS